MVLSWQERVHGNLKRDAAVGEPPGTVYGQDTASIAGCRLKALLSGRAGRESKQHVQELPVAINLQTADQREKPKRQVSAASGPRDPSKVSNPSNRHLARARDGIVMGQ